jgi:2',3'-cyclic-nucleotide 2'-phosphodiesterase
MLLRLLFIGDVVGKPGRRVLTRALAEVVAQRRVHLVVANTENACGGSGLNPSVYEEIVASGVDVLTMGDHVYRNREIMALWGQTDRLVRPCNLPEDAPGLAYTVVPSKIGVEVGVAVALGRVFMKPVDCPFRAVDRAVEAMRERTPCILVDMHAEATSDKQCMGRYLDGRVSAVVGTHTHVPTADEQVLPGGTAYITDVGMTGPYESILGRRIDRVVQATVTQVPTTFGVATGDPRLAGVLIDINPETGRAAHIERFMIHDTSAPQPQPAVAMDRASTNES